jgi:hypothetical protein
MKKLVSMTIAISDTSVSTALVIKTYTRKQNPTEVKPVIVTYRTKSFNPEHKDITSEYLEQRLQTLLRGIIKETRYEDLVKAKLSVRDISRVVISLSAPWFEGRTVTGHFSEAKEFKITKQILDKALDSEIKMISGADKALVTVLESNILNATINGYTVSEPIGKIASTLSLSGYVSYIKTSIFNLVQDVIHSHFHNVDEILIKTEPTVLFSAALEEARKRGVVQDFAIIRVNEILTHMQIVRNGHIKELGTVPIGLNFLLKGIAEVCSVTFEVAINVLELYFQGKLESKFSQKLKQATEITLEHWRIGMKEFSASTLDSGRFPKHVFLSSPTVISHALYTHLASDDYLDLTMSDKTLEVEILDRSTLDAFIDTDPVIQAEPGFLTKLNALM